MIYISSPKCLEACKILSWLLYLANCALSNFLSSLCLLLNNCSPVFEHIVVK